MNMRSLLAALQHGTRKAGGDPEKLLFVECRERLGGGIEGAKLSALTAKLSQFHALGSQLLSEPVQAIPFSAYRLFDTTGDREVFEQAYFSRRKRLDVYAVLSLTNGGEAWIRALEDTIWAICDEYTWCLPAHLGGRSLETGEEHRTALDLFAAETAFYLAEILHVLGDRLSGLVAERAEHEILSRVLQPYASLSPAYGWETADMNWAAVCAGSIGMAAMYLIGEDAEFLPVLHRVLSSMDTYLSGFTEDGACLEGVMYWNYGFVFYTAFAELLRQRTGGEIRLMEQEKIRSIALFQQKCYLGGSAVLSFSDSPDNTEFQPGLTHRLKRYYAEVELPDRQHEAGILADNCFRWIHVIRNLVWYDAGLTAAGVSDTDDYLEQAQIIVSRCTVDGIRIAFSAKGGFNDEPHNHNDAGSFLYFAGGSQLLADPGAGVYSKEYFGPNRYDMIYSGSHGHSVPVVDGCRQQAGRDFRAEVRLAEISETEAVYEMELAGAYACPKLKSLVRHIRFFKADGSLRLTDRFIFGEQPSSYHERFVTFHKPVIDREGLVMITDERSGLTLTVAYDYAQFQASVAEEPFLAKNGDRDRLYLLDISPKIPVVTDTIEVVISLL
ncbi:heparinase II/III domain-containing protein [Paenibacillus gansuensis]|uniref:Heparinase II/III family protein n=1 Tax=Paenibacillus gansuensis TaxID=306542 RepID=A0ABW5P7D8_9BACL